MEEVEIKKELAKFNVTDAAIAEIKKQYMALTIKDLDDVEGYKAVHNARMVVVKKRTAVTKTGKELREDANRFNRAVLTEEKRILALLLPIEDHLDSEEFRIDAEKLRIKAEAEAKEAARIQARIDRLESIGMGLSGGHYRLPFESQGVDVPLALIPTVTDEQFEQFVGKILVAVGTEIARQEDIERNRKAEEDRLAQVAKEQEAERKRLAEEAKRIAAAQAQREAEIKAERDRIRKEQEQREADIKAEQDRVRHEQEQREAAIKAAQDAIEAQKKAIADAKQKAIDDARHAEELEEARKEAAEKARIEAEQKAKHEAEEKEKARLKAIEDERLAKIAEEEEARRREELKPDKEKLLGFADQLLDLTGPELKNKKAKNILSVAIVAIYEIAHAIHNDVERMK